MIRPGDFPFLDQIGGHDDGGKDVFVHITALEASGLPALDEGAKVTFETEPDRRGKGPQAVNVQLAE